MRNWAPLTDDPLGDLLARTDIRSHSQGCWVWKLGKNGVGYGLWRHPAFGASPKLVHRLSYELHVGPIPEGYQIDHLCRNRICCNPAHLEAVTPRTNNLRGQSTAAINARRTECVNGHEFTKANTYVRKDNGARQCIACRNARRRLRRKLRRSK